MHWNRYTLLPLPPCLHFLHRDAREGDLFPAAFSHLGRHGTGLERCRDMWIELRAGFELFPGVEAVLARANALHLEAAVSACLGQLVERRPLRLRGIGNQG